MFTGLSTSQFLGGFILPGAIHTSGIYPSSRLSESYVGQCWTPDQGGVYRVAGSGYGQVRGAKLATTVAEGAILGPELVTAEADRTFSSDTGWWTKQVGCTISGGVASFSGSAVPALYRSLGELGKRFRIQFTLITNTQGGICARSGSTTASVRTSPGDYTEEFTQLTGGVGVGVQASPVSATTIATIDNISIREVIPVWIAPDTYPTRSVRTRFGTARVPTGTDVGMVSSPAFTNKVTARKTNPTDLTNVLQTGDAAGVLSVVDDTAALAAAGLSQICSSGKVYKLDNSAGSLSARATLSGSGSSAAHSARLMVRCSGAGSLRYGESGALAAAFSDLAVYTRVEVLNSTAFATLTVRADAGSVVYFLIPELVESSYLPADPIVPLTPAADTAAAFTRAAIYMEHNTAGVFPTVSVVATLEIGHADNPYTTQATRMSDGSVVPVVSGASWAQNFAVFGTCVPDAVQSSTRIFNSYVNSDNYLLLTLEGATGVSVYTRVGAVSTGLVSTYSHATNAPFDYLCLKTIHGMAIRVRPHATMTWSAWATNVTANGKKPAPIGSKYQIGALNGGGGIAGKHPKVSIFELGNQASLAAYQDRAMLLAGRIA